MIIAVNGTDGVITYTPDTGFTGEDVFTYTVHDH
ncbi:MAG: Ig-like domain-containing protein [Planctomycetota bacterium]